MAYNKQERFLLDRTKRPEPTYYQNQTFDPIKNNKHPFNSTAKRKPMSQEPATHQIYDAEVPGRHIPGCTSIRSDVRRFPYHDLGKDDLEEILCQCGFEQNKPNDNLCACELEQPVECKGKIQRSLFIGPTPRSKYISIGNGLSCPHKTDFGFENLPNGSVRRIFIPLPQPCPEFYDTRPNIFSDYYHGCKWCQWTAKRSTMPVQEGPGPSDYNVVYGFCANDKCAEKVRSLHRKYSKNLRSLDALCEISKHFPGPADYLPKQWPRPGPPTVGPKEERFKEEVDPLPGPGDYNLKRSFEPPEKVKSSFDRIDRLMDIAPFNARAPRFKDKVTSLSPGPIYEPFPGFPHCKRNCVKAPFNCSARRFKCDVYEDSSSDEDCMEHKPEEEDEENENNPDCQNIMWPFKSETKRFKDALKNVSPSPADRPQPRNDLIKRYPRLQYLAPFYASAGRFRRWYGFPPIRCEDTPGPGYYELRKYSCYPAVVAGPLFRASRFKPTAAMFYPAPNEYTMPNTKSVDGVLNTHNIQLKNNIENKHKFVFKMRQKPLPYSNEEKITLLLEKAAEELVPYPEPVDPDTPMQPIKKQKKIKIKRTVSCNKMLRTFLNMRSVPKYY